MVPSGQEEDDPRFAGGIGTESRPYLIATADQLDNMHAEGILKRGEPVYFRLVNDIDMRSYYSEGRRWVPLNPASPGENIIHFDGNSHTIMNFSCSFSADADDAGLEMPSFFGVLYGSCHDVSFTGASVETDSGVCGILAGYIGSPGKQARVYNVRIFGSVTKTAAAGDAGVGGLGGRICFAFIDSCTADVTVTCTEQDNVGGLFGMDYGTDCRVRNCRTSGKVSGKQKVGGICGALTKPESKIINCLSTATVDALRLGGGIAGFCALDASSTDVANGRAGELLPDNVVKGCIAWQTSFTTRDQAGHKDRWASGAVVGLTATHNYLSDCRRNPALSFRDLSDEFTLYDQENADPATPLVVINPKPSTYTHYSPYHGKAAASTNVSAVARDELHWDSKVWNFSGSVPSLTGAVEEEEEVTIPVSGESDVPQGAKLDREFPVSGTRNGMTWEVEAIGDGLTYYHACGKPSESWMDGGNSRIQELYAVTCDLGRKSYDVRLVYTSSSIPTSEAFAAFGAYAAVNCAYERPSIALKTNAFYDVSKMALTDYPNGYPVSYMPNNYIFDGAGVQVPNWKSEGTFYTDGHQGVRIAFDAYAGGARDEFGNGTSVRTVAEERLFYKYRTGGEAAMISSAPVLDANYTRFGCSFKDRMPDSGSGSNEEPVPHQTTPHPCTAVGIAYPDGKTPHLLLVVFDGRYAESTGRGYGMTAEWLERYVAEYFGPKYLLNLDGGGSSTMCVKDHGDSATHVVNYPCDNYTSGGVVDHSGERKRDTFLCLIPSGGRSGVN